MISPILEKDNIFIEIELKNINNDDVVFTNVECFLSLYVYKYLQVSNNVNLCFVRTTFSNKTAKVQLNKTCLLNEFTKENVIIKETAGIAAINDLRLPIYQKDNNTFIAGVSAVCRALIRKSTKPELLGFKESCLLAPAEASIWTRFCELDMVDAIKKIFLQTVNNEPISELPKEVSRFEKHMNQPVRMHNIYKLAREQAKQEPKPQQQQQSGGRKQKIIFDNSIPKEELQIKHRFAEGVAFTIADLFLYAGMCFIFEHCKDMRDSFPLTNAWMSEIDDYEPKCKELLQNLRVSHIKPTITSPLKIIDCETCSLYKSDPKRYKPKNRIYTEQSKVEKALNKLQEGLSNNEFNSERPNDFEDTNIDWNTVEPAHEKNSALPQERLARKRQQLENMANAVSAIAAPGDRIIDFCSGTGHLGILLGLQLRSCTVILIENKAISLERAKKRAKELNLDNCHFYQCNIDYFVGNFDLGTSLHACGTATDIVLQQCQRSRAKFVCCPCCYGSLCPMPHITYPLSERFRHSLAAEDFNYIAHAADQAHELGATNCRPETSLQGQLCMDIVDSDRKFCAEEAGYEVILTRLKPELCTPKNRLLVGWMKNQHS